MVYLFQQCFHCTASLVTPLGLNVLSCHKSLSFDVRINFWHWLTVIGANLLNNLDRQSGLFSFWFIVLTFMNYRPEQFQDDEMNTGHG